MKATALEYRFRFALHAILFVLGYWAPWTTALGWTDKPLWPLAAMMLLKHGWLGFGARRAGGAGVCAGDDGAGCLVQGLGDGVCEHGDCEVGHDAWGDAAGGWAFPAHAQSAVSGDAATYAGCGDYLCRRAERCSRCRCCGCCRFGWRWRKSRFCWRNLGRRIGSIARGCRGFCRCSPPRCRLRVRVRTGCRLSLGEIYFPGVFLTLAIFGWSFNNTPIRQGLLISLGVWFVALAFVPRLKREAA